MPIGALPKSSASTATRSTEKEARLLMTYFACKNHVVQSGTMRVRLLVQNVEHRGREHNLRSRGFDGWPIIVCAKLIVSLVTR